MPLDHARDEDRDLDDSCWMCGDHVEFPNAVFVLDAVEVVRLLCEPCVTRSDPRFDWLAEPRPDSF